MPRPQFTVRALLVATFLGCASQQGLASTFDLDVINNTQRDFVEFRIRASDSGRPWTKVRLRARETETIALVSDDPFDVEIWRWQGDGHWIVSRQTDVFLKDDSDGHAIRMELSMVNPDGDKPDTYYGFGYAVLDVRHGGKNKSRVRWRVESNPFRLIIPD